MRRYHQDVIDQELGVDHRRVCEDCDKRMTSGNLHFCPADRLPQIDCGNAVTEKREQDPDDEDHRDDGD